MTWFYKMGGSNGFPFNLFSYLKLFLTYFYFTVRLNSTEKNW